MAGGFDDLTSSAFTSNSLFRAGVSYTAQTMLDSSGTTTWNPNTHATWTYGWSSFFCVLRHLLDSSHPVAFARTTVGAPRLYTPPPFIISHDSRLPSSSSPALRIASYKRPILVSWNMVLAQVMCIAWELWQTFSWPQFSRKPKSCYRIQMSVGSSSLLGPRCWQSSPFHCQASSETIWIVPSASAWVPSSVPNSASSWTSWFWNLSSACSPHFHLQPHCKLARGWTMDCHSWQNVFLQPSHMVLCTNKGLVRRLEFAIDACYSRYITDVATSEMTRHAFVVQSSYLCNRVAPHESYVRASSMSPWKKDINIIGWDRRSDVRFHFDVMHIQWEDDHLRNCTGMMPPTALARRVNIGYDRSKWVLGGLHHPPLLVGLAGFAGQRFVAVTLMEPALGKHHLVSATLHLISKQAPQVSPLLKRVELKAVVSRP